MAGVAILLLLCSAVAVGLLLDRAVRPSHEEQRRVGLFGPLAVDSSRGSAARAAASPAVVQEQERNDEDDLAAREFGRLRWIGARIVAVERLNSAWWRVQFSDGTTFRICTFQPRLVRHLRHAADWEPTVPQRVGRNARTISIEFASSSCVVHVTAERIVAIA